MLGRIFVQGDFMTSCRPAGLALILFGVASSWVVDAQQNPMREGRWEVTVQMEMAAAAMKLPPMTTTQCVTKEQVENPASGIPTGPGNAQNDCKVSDYTFTADKVSWSMACSTPQAMTGTGALTFTGSNAYTGVVMLTTPQGAMTMQMSGKRLGDCTPQ
jgi:hypothetical protein